MQQRIGCLARLLEAGLRGTFTAATGVFGLLTLLGFLARWTQPFELISHFRLQYAAALLAMTCLWALFRGWRASALAACFFCLNAGAIGAAVLPASTPAMSLVGPRVRLVWANLQGREASLARVAELARSQRADIVALTELPAGGEGDVRTVFADFACFTSSTGRVTTFTTMIASRAPCSSVGEASSLPRPSDASFADIAALRVVALHPRPPWNNERTAERDSVIRAARRLGLGMERTILVGDFNASPWSPVMVDLKRQGFRRALCGAPFAPTWRSANPLFGLAIDHAYVHGELAVAHCRIGPDIGSDHRPLIVEVSTARSSAQVSRFQD